MVQNGLTKFIVKHKNVNETQYVYARYVICVYFESSSWRIYVN